MINKQVAVVTGGNKGIGFEVARQLGRKGYAVVIGCRDAGRGEAAAVQLRNERLDVRAVMLDVTVAGSAVAAAARVEAELGRVDVLVNNAGIALERSGVADADLANVRATFETNVFGVLAVTQAFLPLVRSSPAGRIVNVSSGLGSLAQNADSTWAHAAIKPAAYNSSKAALNMLTVILASELNSTPIKVNAADPGYTATDLNGNSGTQTIEVGSEAILHLATLGPDGPTGGYFDRKGPVAW